MSEITKLRTRLKNATKSTTEYRMTMKEAVSLLAEIDQLKVEASRPAPTPQPIAVERIDNRVMDGGSFDDF